MIVNRNKPSKNTIFDFDSIAKLMKNLSLSFLFVLILVSCNSTKHVTEDEHMLTKNNIFVDSVKKIMVAIYRNTFFKSPILSF